MKQKESVGVGIVGWGLGGRIFHAPFIRYTEGLALVAAVTSREIDRQLYPDVAIAGSVEALLSRSDIDLVVIATPNKLHVPHALLALEAGKHVVVEKPLARTADEVRQLQTAARDADRLLIPFQNRRWDGDFLTVKQLIGSGELGRIYHFGAQWPKYRPNPKPRAAWKSDSDVLNGLIYDLGAHMVDQVLHLFGTPHSVNAQLDFNIPDATTHDRFVIDMLYTHGLTARLEVDLLDPRPAPRFAVCGTQGSFFKEGLDPQEPQLVAGMLPGDPKLGVEATTDWGTRVTAKNAERIETRQGNYAAFYYGVCEAVAGDGGVPISVGSVLSQIAVIEAAVISAETGSIVTIDPSVHDLV
jgi:scyllo-inositol 2-dehydrogenase (NADP+)